MDAAQLGKTAADFMEQLDETEETFAEDGATDIRLGEIVIIGEIFYTDDEGNTICSVTTASSTENRIHQSGIVTWGHRLIDDTGTNADPEDDE